MQFTYDAYGRLLKLLKDKGYVFSNYFNWRGKKKCVILRHDIDFDIEKALRLARFEKDGGLQALIS